MTGYQDFLSSLAILLDSVPDLLHRPPGSYRIIFGSNTEGRKTLGGEGRSVDAEARSHFLGSHGLSVSDLADLRAVLAVEAIERGIIQLRVFDQDLARDQIGRRPTMLHAKLFVGAQTVLSGSANFSLGGLRRNLEFTDDATAWPDLAKARRNAAEQFWAMGRDWNDTALEILHALSRGPTNSTSSGFRQRKASASAVPRVAKFPTIWGSMKSSHSSKQSPQSRVRPCATACRSCSKDAAVSHKGKQSMFSAVLPFSLMHADERLQSCMVFVTREASRTAQL